MIKGFFLFFFLVGAHFLSAQLLQFGKVVCDTNYTDLAVDVDRLPDNSLVTVSDIRFPTGNNSKILVSRTDSVGSLIFARVFQINNSPTFPYFLEVTSDSCFIVGGSYNNFSRNSDLFIVKFDSLGNVIWHKEYGWTWTTATSAMKEFDKRYYFTGITCGPFPGDQKAFILVLDEDGNYVRENCFHDTGDFTTGTDITCINDRVVVSGICANSGNQVFVLETDTLFTQTNSIITDSMFLNADVQLAVYPNGEKVFFIFGGNGPSNEITAVKLNSSHQVVWIRDLVLPWSNTYMDGSRQRKDNENVIFWGLEPGPAGIFRPLMFELDSSLNQIWSLKSATDSLKVFLSVAKEYSTDHLMMSARTYPVANSVTFKMQYNSNACMVFSDTLVTVNEVLTFRSGMTATNGMLEFPVILNEINWLPYEDLICYVTVPEEEILIDIPNIFSPNGDDMNDFLELFLGGTRFRIHLFDRWGNIVSEFEGDHYIWDGNNRTGKPCSAGVYYFVLELTDGSQTRKGYLHLTR